MSVSPNLEQALREIERSPEGASIIAFFDLDGTLISGYSVTHMTRDRIKERELGLGELLRTISTALAAGMGAADFRDLLQIGADNWAGRDADSMDEMGERLFRRKIKNLLHPGMREIVKAHQAKGHTVVLSSSATCYQVDPVARHLNIDNVICNRFEIDNGLLTGEISEPVIWSKTKATAAQAFAETVGVEVDTCWFYADGDEDLALMHIVGYPRPVNPGKKLARIARRRGWPVLEFGKRIANNSIRHRVGLASIVPSVMVGAGLSLLTQNRRAGINLGIPLWLDALFASNEVKLNIIGRDNAWAARPAVFIFNHRNQFDAFFAGRVVEKDFTSVGKKELEKHWLMGPVGKILDAAFIDRADSKASVDALKALEDLARKGLSVLIAPEGTRVEGIELGSFKKGAFRIAMGTQLPIVPIVIRNADDIASRDSPYMSPGEVDIAVLPAIDVSEWTLEDLPEHIRAIEELYRRTLANWPGEDELSALRPGAVMSTAKTTRGRRKKRAL